MDERHRTILRKSRTIFIKDLSNVTTMCDKLFSYGVLTEEMVNEIKGETGREPQVRKLLDILPRRGKQAYGFFYQSLVETGEQELADILQPELAIKPMVEKSKTVDEEPTRYDKSSLQRAASTPDPHPRPDLSFPERFTPPIESLTKGVENLRNNSTTVPTSFLPFSTENIQPMKVKVLPCDQGDRQKILARNDSIYLMESKPKGKVIIINNFEFDSGHNIPMRDKQCHDISSSSMSLLFKQLKFKVSTKSNVKSKELLDIITKEQTSEECCDCFVMVILSHGCNDLMFMSDGVPLDIQNIISEFDANHCPKLEGKPKLFFIHACPSDHCATSSHDSIPKGIVNDGDEHTNKLTKADIFVARATTYDPVQIATESKGFKSFQAFIHLMQYYARDHHLLDIMTKVKGLATEDRELVETMDTLRKELYFFPE